jgi:hypothetical protein
MLSWQGMDLAECLFAPPANYRQEIQVPTVRPKGTTKYRSVSGKKPNAVGKLKNAHNIKLVVFY